MSMLSSTALGFSSSPVTTITGAAGGSFAMKSTVVSASAGTAVAARTHEARRVARNSTAPSSSLASPDASPSGSPAVVVALILDARRRGAAVGTEPLPAGTTIVPRDGSGLDAARARHGALRQASSTPDAADYGGTSERAPPPRNDLGDGHGARARRSSAPTRLRTPDVQLADRLGSPHADNIAVTPETGAL